VVALLASLDGELASLRAKMRWHAGAPFRPKKDEAPESQLAFELLRMLTGRLGQEPASDEVEPSEAEVQTGEGDQASPAPPTSDELDPPGERGARPRRKRRGRELRRKVDKVKITDTQVPACPCCAKPLREMGFEVRERFMYQPAEVYILEEQIYKYGCRCGEVIITAEPTEPPKPIPGGMASSSLLAQLGIGKVLDGNPVERFAKQLRRQNIDLPTSTLHDWFGRLGDLLAVMRRACHRQLLTCDLISLDDTPVRARNADHPANVQTGRQWLYLGDIHQSIRSPMPSSPPTGKALTPSGCSKVRAAISRTMAMRASIRCSSAPTHPSASAAMTTADAGLCRPSSKATVAHSR
jgi:transposase